MTNLFNICSDKWILVATFSIAIMVYMGSKQYKLLGNGEVRRCFRDRFYEILSIVLAAINWPLFAMNGGKMLTALQNSKGVSEAMLIVEEDRTVGMVAIMLFGFPILFFLFGKLAALAKLGYFYDWDEPAEDIVEQDKILQDQDK